MYIDGSVQNCSNSIANALELLQSCTKPSISTIESTNQPSHLNIIIAFFYIKHEKCDNDFTSWPSHDMQNAMILYEISIVIRELWWREFPSTQQ